jgi:VanZ family protein
MRHRSTAIPLAWAVAALVVYASLYPFAGWRWPPGVDGAALLRLPWPPWLDRLDAAANFFGYVPLGALIAGAVLRGGGRRTVALAAALLLSTGLAYAVELGQQFLPSRVPSLKDCAFNLGGAALGALLALAVQAAGVVDRWQGVRERWFARDSALALGLLLLWPAALLFPTPAPLALGHVWGEARDALQAAFDGTPWAADAAAWLGDRAAGANALTLLQEGLAVVLGLLAPCLLAYATTHPGWHRALLSLGALAVGVVVTTLSTGLNFGPQHALAWWTAATLPALALGTALALALMAIGRRLAAALGLTVVALLLALVAQAPSDPYYAASLQGWEQGRFIRFHGLAQWVGWLWPFAAMAWLLARLAQRGDA